MTSARPHLRRRRRHEALISVGALALSAGVVGVGAAPAIAADMVASDDTALTGSGVPVTSDVLANDHLSGEVASVQVGPVVGGDASTVTVGDDFRITFANASSDYPNSSTARVFKTADFVVPYTVTRDDGSSASATLTVTVAGKPVSPTISSWLLMDPSAGTKTVTSLTQLDLRAYPQTIASYRSAIPGVGVSVTGLVAGEHASAGTVTGGIELRAEPRSYVGNDVVTLRLTDTWGRGVDHKTGVSWVDRAAIAKLRTKVGVGQSAKVDLREAVAATSFASFAGAGFTSTRDVFNGTVVTGDHAQDLTITPKAGFVGTSTDSVGTRLAWAYRLSNPWQPAGYTGPATDAKTNYLYVDVQAPPKAVDVAASTRPGQPVDLDLRTPATLPWSASAFELRERPEHGTVTVSGAGQVTYTPAADFPEAQALAATDSFTFAWTDDLGQESVARATVTVRSTPTLADHARTTPAGVAVGVDLLAGSFGDGIRITDVGSASSGDVDLSGTYQPHDGFVGDDSFTYAGVDAHGQAAQGTVRIRVVAAPAIVDQHYRTPRNTAVEFDPIVLDTTAGYQPEMVLDSIGEPEHGTVIPGADGTLVYLPDADFLGLDRLTVSARDAGGQTAEALVTIEIYGNEAPIEAPTSTAPVPTVPPAPAPAAPGADPIAPAAEPAAGGTTPAKVSSTTGSVVAEAVQHVDARAPHRTLAMTGGHTAALLGAGALLLGVGVVAVVLRGRGRERSA